MSEARQTERLGDICYIKARIGWRGLSSSEYTEDGPYLIAGQHIRGGQITWDKCDHITEQRYLESHEIILRFGDVIITKDGTIGRVARIDDLPGDATINGTMMLVRPLRRLDFRYLYHILNGRDFQKLIDDKVSGSSIPHLFQRDMVELKVELPSRDHQSKIAEVLDMLDKAIRETEAVLAKLKAMKQGLLHDLLTRGIDANGDLRPSQSEAPHLYKQTPLGWLPKEWDVIELGSLTRELTQGWSPDCPSEVALAHEWGILKTTAVVWSGYQEHENKRLPERMRPRPFLQVEVDDILITRAGPSSRVAVVVHVPDTRDKLMISDKLYRLRVTSAYNPSFVATALSSMAVQREISKTISGMAESQTNISQAALKPLLVPIPSRREQDEIILGLQAQSQKLRDEEDLLEKLRLQKIGLMDDLLTGSTSVAPLL